MDDIQHILPSFEIASAAISSQKETFPDGTNVEFVQVLSRSHVSMKVWERGAGPTLACGTGACAVVAAAMLQGLVDHDGGRLACRVTLPGGDLFIRWSPGTGPSSAAGGEEVMYMTGEARFVYSGVISI